MAEAIDTPPHICAQCGAEFTGRKKKYCSQRCGWVAASRRKGKRPRSEQRAEQYARTHRECPECKIMFRITRHDNHSKGPQVYCSVDCRHAEAKRRTAQADAVATAVATLRKWGMGYGRGAAATKYQRWGKRARTPCQDCGKPVGVARTRIYPASRCEPCAVMESKRAAKASPSRRAAKAKRRALERGLEAERFDPFEIFDRDGWRCHICGVKTPKKLRGTYEDRAPELDHLVPLASGGEHSRRNTACSCRKCNIAKGDRPLGQLRLIA